MLLCMTCRMAALLMKDLVSDVGAYKAIFSVNLVRFKD